MKTSEQFLVVMIAYSVGLLTAGLQTYFLKIDHIALMIGGLFTMVMGFVITFIWDKEKRRKDG